MLNLPYSQKICICYIFHDFIGYKILEIGSSSLGNFMHSCRYLNMQQTKQYPFSFIPFMPVYTVRMIFESTNWVRLVQFYTL